MEHLIVLILLLVFILVSLSRRKSTKPIGRQSAPKNRQRVELRKKALSSVSIRQVFDELPQMKVLEIVDGDTVIVSKGWNELKIRLDSIDCPEAGQDWGNTAKYGLIKLIGGKKVRVEEHGLDGYGRTLGTIYVWHSQKNEWLNVNERMVTLGHAWVMRKYYGHLPKDRQNKLNSLERWAKSRKVGLWKTSNPIPPWKWRNELE